MGAVVEDKLVATVMALIVAVVLDKLVATASALMGAVVLDNLSATVSALMGAVVFAAAVVVCYEYNIDSLSLTVEMFDLGLDVLLALVSVILVVPVMVDSLSLMMLTIGVEIFTGTTSITETSASRTSSPRSKILSR